MGIFWQKGWLVNLQLKGNKFGSGILINDQGFILTAFHNVYGNTLGEHIIEKATTSLDGNWHQTILHISDKNNITVQCPDKSLARKIDLIAIKAEGTSFTRSPLQIATELPKETDTVILLTYDPNNSKHNHWREESAIVGQVFYEDNFCFFPLHKVNGIPGASGGGVFTQDGKLLGIIKQTRTDNGDYIASFIGDPRFQHLFPLSRTTPPSLLDARRQQRTQKSSPPKRQKKVDCNILANCDLQDLKKAFYQKTNRKGIFTFAINGSGKRDILRKYVIECIKTQLKNITNRHCIETEIPLFAADIMDLSSRLKTRFNKKLNDLSLTELIGEKNYIDILLVIWNYEIPCHELQHTIKFFHKEIESELDSMLNNHQYSFCFIIIWANVSPYDDLLDENNGISLNLPLPNNFKLEELKTWFCEELSKLQIDKSNIELHYEELETPNGHLVGTYDALEKIFQNL